MSGDKVQYLAKKNGTRYFAQIEKILERKTTEVIGILKPHQDRIWLETLDQTWFGIEPAVPPTQIGNWARAKIVQPPTRHHMGLVRVEEVWGKELSPRLDIPWACAQFGLRKSFTAQVEEEAERLKIEGQQELSAPSSGRKDLTHLPFITIDGPDAKDFDDAICVELKANGKGYILWVAIADVSFFVRTGSFVDKEAKNRATSVYFPGTCLPMLPEVLSNDLCSLRPEVPRLTLTVEIHYDEKANIQQVQYYPSIIKTHARMTYEQVQKFFDLKPNDNPLSQHLASLSASKGLYTMLRAETKRRGVLDFDLPESSIQVDSEGMPISSGRATRYVSHRLIETFMVAANSVVAKILREANCPALYRVHEKPDDDTLEDINLLMRRLGIPHKIHKITPTDLAMVLDATAEHQGSRTVHQAILRLQKQAHYGSKPDGHFGLALQDYTHFTSPIRRYPDLVVHRALKRLIDQTKKTDKSKATPAEPDMESLGQHTSQRERQAMEAERFVVKRKQCWFLFPRQGETFPGIVTGMTAKGLYVDLGDVAIEGFLPVDALQGYFQFDEGSHCYRKRPGNRRISLGDPITVQLEHVDILSNYIRLSEVKVKEEAKEDE